MLLTVGGYTHSPDGKTPTKAKGISFYEFSPKVGRLRFLFFAPAVNPSYVLTDRKKQIVYAVSERSAERGAAISLHRPVREKNGKYGLAFLRGMSIPGDDPCHLAFAENTLLVSCHTSGTVHVIGLDDDGVPTELLQSVTLRSGPGQSTPRAHCAAYLPDRSAVLVCDLGSDLLRVFRRHEDGRLSEAPELALSFPTGEGPRHIAIHPSGDYAVVNGECVGRVHLIDLRGDKPFRMMKANALPERVIDEASGAAIRWDSRGKMVYTSDRTFSVINSLRLDERSGKLIFRDTNPSGGESPRDLVLSPDGKWLLTANTTDATIGVFKVGSHGELVHYHTFGKVPAPTSLAWL